MRSKEISLIVLALFILGGGLFLYRALVLGFPVTPNKSVQSWHVEAKIAFSTAENAAKAEIFLPRSSLKHTIVDENFVSDGFGLTSRENPETGNRIATWTKRKPHKKEILYYRAILYETNTVLQQPSLPKTIDVPVFGTAEFEALSKERADYFSLNSIIAGIREKSIDNESFALELFRTVNSTPENSFIVQLKDGVENLNSNAAVAVHILKHAGIPARIMNGVSLKENARNVGFTTWAQVFVNDRWMHFNPETGVLGQTQNYLEWWVGDAGFQKLSGAKAPSISVSVKEHTESALTEAIWKGDSTREAIYKISIFNLPVDIQLVFSVLLLVPLGALIVCLMRQVVGIQTFGTFMPILVALSFRETQLFWGLFFFGIITALGMFFRGYLNRLQLLMVPRLSAIMVLVVLSIYALSVIIFNFNIHSGLSISLFPLVILTMLIERMSMTWEEFGAGTALKSAAGSIFVAIISYAFMSNDVIEHLMLTFPELLLIILAFTIMIGRYNGYKLTEYYRFRVLSKQLSSKE